MAVSSLVKSPAIVCPRSAKDERRDVGGPELDVSEARRSVSRSELVSETGSVCRSELLKLSA